MAYVVGDIRVQIQGTLPGGEIFSNTWAVEGAVDAAARTAAVGRIHNFYNQIQGLLSDQYNAQVATVRDLFANVTYDEFFDDVPGTDTEVPLPTSTAIRVSLSGGTNVQGGPFLSGFTVTDLVSPGVLASAAQATIADEVEDLAEELDGLGLSLALDSPKNLALFTVHTVRVGERFDVIRKRANDLLESYETRLVP